MFIKDTSEVAIVCIEQKMVQYNLSDYVVLSKSKHLAKLGQSYWNFIWGKASEKGFPSTELAHCQIFWE